MKEGNAKTRARACVRGRCENVRMFISTFAVRNENQNICFRSGADEVAATTAEAEALSSRLANKREEEEGRTHATQTLSGASAAAVSACSSANARRKEK